MVSKNVLFQPFIYKSAAFHQDRLGTNTGKTPKKYVVLRWPHCTYVMPAAPFNRSIFIIAHSAEKGATNTDINPERQGRPIPIETLRERGDQSRLKP